MRIGSRIFSSQNKKYKEEITTTISSLITDPSSFDSGALRAMKALARAK